MEVVVGAGIGHRRQPVDDPLGGEYGDTPPIPRVEPQPVEPGQQVEAVIVVDVGEHDGVGNHAGAEQGREHPGSAVQEDGGATGRDEVAGGGTAAGGIGPVRSEDVESHRRRV